MTTNFSLHSDWIGTHTEPIGSVGGLLLSSAQPLLQQPLYMGYHSGHCYLESYILNYFCLFSLTPESDTSASHFC